MHVVTYDFSVVHIKASHKSLGDKPKKCIHFTTDPHDIYTRKSLSMSFGDGMPLAVRSLAVASRHRVLHIYLRIPNRIGDWTDFPRELSMPGFIIARSSVIVRKLLTPLQRSCPRNTSLTIHSTIKELRYHFMAAQNIGGDTSRSESFTLQSFRRQ